MRLVPVLLIALALSFAGCFGKKSDDTNPTDGGASTPAETTPSGSASSTPVSSTPTGTDANATTPAALAPKVICTDKPDFSTSGAPAGGTTPADKTCTVDAGYTKLTLNVNATPTQAPAGGVGGGVLGGQIDVKIGGADCSFAQGPVSAVTTCTKPGTATPGPMKITYSGGPAAGVNFDVSVTESQ